MPKKYSCRQRIMKKLRAAMKKDSSRPARLVKWLKVIDHKKEIFAIEDEIDGLLSELRSRKGRMRPR